MPADPAQLRELLAHAATFAKPPVSNFHVGALARGTTTGTIYPGANLEFAGETLSFTVHAEQSAITNAWVHGEEGVDLVATTAAPCGYCRQFLNELGTPLTIVINDSTHTLAELLPSSFGPRDLGVEATLMAPRDNGLRIDEVDELAQAGLRAANRSYAPYSRSYAGVALRARGGRIFVGPYAENAAFNPSMEPLQVALSALNLAGGAFEDVEEAVLVQSKPLHESATRAVLAAVSGAALRVINSKE